VAFDAGTRSGLLRVPDAADVRYGTPVDATMGTCYVPSAASVALGVPVDNTTGTLVPMVSPTAQQIADALKLAPASGAPAAGSVMAALADKTGYQLAANGLDALSAAVPSGPAVTVRDMIVQLWRRFFKKAILDHNAGTLTTYADDGATTVTTQTATATATVETQGPAE
jgi:hypothetical protein